MSYPVCVSWIDFTPITTQDIIQIGGIIILAIAAAFGYLY